ncbi:uncharacterized protein EI90DRAFT_3129660 [Cantharellus anzutake]|uniref:uncharacterized protein n=1 Tax=Cantharellus anzutake TaxID=1750568 RepID=UPI001906656C|nr:uncharacterized protein EI90DRAFT_3129660 [Cantharellus anzutake]KAF8324694.1 hypothetical protein EI90DRAFT_3129660 [Cantharellus anzutake]
MFDLNYYVQNKDKRPRWNDDHILGLAPRPLPKTPLQAFQQYFTRGDALFLPDNSDRVLDALDPSAHDLSPSSWAIPFPLNWEALQLDDPTRVQCETFILRKQKAEQECKHHGQPVTTSPHSIQAVTTQSPTQHLYTAYPIMYPLLPFPSQPSLFLPQQSTTPSGGSPPIATLAPAPDMKLPSKSQSDGRGEKLLEICYQCNTLNPDKATTEASFYLPIDYSASFALCKIEEGMDADTVEQMEKALRELRECMSRARTSKKLYIINIKPVPKAEDLGKRGKSRRSNTLNDTILSNPASEKYTMLEKQWECHRCRSYCWPHTHARGKHLHLSNAMLSLWAQQWTDHIPGVDLHNPPAHHWFDVAALRKQTKAVNEKQHQESKKRSHDTSPPKTPTKSKKVTSPPAKKVKVDVIPAKQEPEKETIILSSDPITPVFLRRRSSKVGTDFVDLSSSPIPGPSKKKDPVIFNLCSDSSADGFDIEYTKC